MRDRSRGRSRDRLRITPSTLRWIGAGAMVVALAAILAGCGSSSGTLTPTQTPNLLNTNGPIAYKEQVLFWVIFGIATFIFVVVTGVLIYSIFKFRARPNSPAPRQIAGNTTLEIAWTIVPSVVLLLVLFATIFTLFNIQQPSGPALVVNVIGHQWWWEFDYPAQNGISTSFKTADELVIPANTIVHFNLASDNVIHSFWVPQLGGKTDVIPGHNNAMWLEANSPGGPYRGECAEFCGTQHAHMDFYVMAVSSGDFQSWVAQQQQGPATPPSGSPEAAGEQYFAHSACVSCHIINSVDSLPAPIGPNLTHFGSRLIIAGGVLDNNPSNLKLWITNAQGVKPGVDMPSFQGQISDSDLNNLVAYLESLK